MIALYHRVYRRENFETAANDLMGLLYMAQEREPNEPRSLFVDIDGHKNEVGGFDEDMRELQTEFGIEILLPFVEELHFPLVSVKNPIGQRNDIPKKIVIGNQRNERDTSLDRLYIENYSNTEFLSEMDVYEYMEEVSIFLKEYTESIKFEHEKEEFDTFGWLGMWRKHMNELSIELFNSFVFGNLLSVAAMTRSLIESYIFMCILKKEKSQVLIHEWWLCNMIHKAVVGDKVDKKRMKSIKSYCRMHKINFDEKWNYYTTKVKGGSGWLRELMGDRGISVKALCKYIGEDEIFEDYQSASDFVHGQDITTKTNPFISYSSIYVRLYLMMDYIFKSMQLFEVDSEIELQIADLEYELIELGKNYIR